VVSGPTSVTAATPVHAPMPVTVLMPVFDTPPAMLRAAIESILNQSFRPFEFLILDDGSRSPDTLSVLDRYALRDRRIRICREPHRGVTGALNRGLELARGEWIARQDADDWSARTRLERQAAFLKENPRAVLCGAQASMHRADGRALWPTRLPGPHERIRAAFPRGNPFVHGATMFRAGTARAIGGYCEEFPCAQDYDFFWRLSEAGEARNLDEILYHYRFTSGAVSARRAGEQAQAHRAAGILARARESSEAGEATDVAHALDQAGRAADARGGALRAALKQADHRMLAGDYFGAAKAFGSLTIGHPGSPWAWAKLARCAVYTLLPAAREACFREAHSR